MLVDIFQYEFLMRAFLSGLCIGILAPLMGMFLVVRRFSLLADTLSHVSLLGVALAVWLKQPIFLGALFTALLGGFGMEALRRSGRVMNEAILALFLSGSLAFALIFLALAEGVNVNLLSYLFGSITTVTREDVILLIALTALILLFMLAAYRKLFLISLDEDLARVDGVKVNRYNFFFILIASLVVAAALPMVGVLLIGALMIVPVLAAMQWRLSFFATLITGVAVAEISVVAGFFFSYYFNLPSGATIVLVAIGIFLLSYLFGGQKSRIIALYKP